MAEVNPIPNGMHTVTPHLICRNAIEAVGFYTRAFGAVELMKLVAPNGQLVHAGLRVGDSMIMLAEECAENPGPGMGNVSPVIIHLMVADVDAFVAKAEAAGATITMPVAEMFWGDRYGQLTDPYGHRWSVGTHVRDVSYEEMQRAAATSCLPDKDGGR